MKPKSNLIIRQLMVFTLLLFIAAMCKKDDNPVGPEENGGTPGTKLIDTTLNNVNTDMTITVKSKMTITIPQGVIPAGTKLTVQSVAPSSLPPDKNIEFNTAYEVSLSSGNSFNKDLTITINYDPTKLPAGKLKNRVGASYYHESMKSWKIFNDVNIDTIKNTVTFKTNHLTKLAVWQINRTIFGYTDYLETPYFVIYWKEGAIPTNAVYNSSNKSQYASTDPHYIKDIAKYLQEAYSNYFQNGFKLPSLKTNVYVTQLTASDGETNFVSGSIKISNDIEFNKDFGETQEKSLKAACAHELMHVVQDYYYAIFLTGLQYRWWLEATATLADRIVWPNNAPYESELYLSSGDLSIGNSWDDCSKDPDWYQAGGFLTYLNYYRPGTKVSVINLIKECGSASQGPLIRGIINSWLINNSNTTIEKEYHNYLLWYFNNGKYFQYKSKSTNEEFTTHANLGTTSKSKDFKGVNIPYMASKVIRAVNYNSPNEKLKVKYESKSTSLHAYYYSNYEDQNKNIITKFERKLNPKDSIEIFMPNYSIKWADILVINESYSSNATFDTQFNLLATPTITSISPSSVKAGQEVTITGTDFGNTKGTSKLLLGSTEISSITSWSNTSIKFPAPATIGTHNIQVEVNGEKSNIVQLVIQGDIDFGPLQDCKFIDIEIPLYATFSERRDVNGVITNTTRDEYARVDYDLQSTNSQNQITLNGTSFSDSVKITESNGTIKTISIKGSFSSDFSKINSITYIYESNKLTNDTNFVASRIECVVSNIPYSSKNATSTAYYYGSYANQGKAVVTSYKSTYHSLQTMNIGQNQVSRTEVKSEVTSFKNFDTQYISTAFRKTQ